jgi:hypothetical protein
MTRLQQFNSAINKVNDERGAVYGDPRVNFARIAAFWSTLFGCEVQPWQVPLAMVLLKTSRLIESPTDLDGYVDIAGYARTGVMVTDDSDPA